MMDEWSSGSSFLLAESYEEAPPGAMTEVTTREEVFPLVVEVKCAEADTCHADPYGPLSFQIRLKQRVQKRGSTACLQVVAFMTRRVTHYAESIAHSCRTPCCSSMESNRVEMAHPRDARIKVGPDRKLIAKGKNWFPTGKIRETEEHLIMAGPRTGKALLP